jgi:hypothetical protein
MIFVFNRLFKKINFTPKFCFGRPKYIVKTAAPRFRRATPSERKGASRRYKITNTIKKREQNRNGNPAPPNAPSSNGFNSHF